MFATTITRPLAATAAATALLGGALAAATGPANAAVLPDVAVKQNLLPYGCEAVVTNIGGATARNVQVRSILGPPTQYLGDIAPGQTKTASYIDCAFNMFGVRVVVTTANGDSNPFNNVARIYP